jgi:hypothetical protein
VRSGVGTALGVELALVAGVGTRVAFELSRRVAIEVTATTTAATAAALP